MAITDDIGDVVRDYTYDVYGQSRAGQARRPTSLTSPGSRSEYPGDMVVLKNGTRIGFRTTSRSGPPTINIQIPGQQAIKIKFLP